MTGHGGFSELREDSRSVCRNKNSCNDDLIKLDVMRAFLEKSRERAAQLHEDSISLLESQYLARLQAFPGLPSLALGQRGAGVAVDTQNGGVEGIHKCCNSNNTSVMTTDVSVVEIELDESDEEELREKKHAWALPRHSRTPPSSPPSRSDSHGISPEMCTPFSLRTTLMSSRGPTTPLEEVRILSHGNGNDDKNNENGSSCGVEKIPVVNASTTPLSAKMDRVDVNIGSSTSKSVSRLPHKRHCTIQHDTLVDHEEEHNVTRCLMQSFGNHTGELAPQRNTSKPPLLPAPTSPSHSVDLSMEPELQEFLLWQAEKSVKRRESLQMAHRTGSQVAKVYVAAAAPEVRWPLLFDCCSNNKAIKPPLTPDSSPSRFIAWIADEVDCYEDLLLHLTVAAEEVERGVVGVVVDVVIDKFTAECVLDCILQNQLKRKTQ